VTAAPLHLCFLGCGFITRVHSRHLRRLRPDLVCSYASRDLARAEAYCREHGGRRAFGSYEAAIGDPEVEAVVIAVPPRFHLDLTLQALVAGKHVLVEKPAYPTTAEYETVLAAQRDARRAVLVGENDHYKPLAECLRRLLRDGAVGELVFAHFTTLVHRLKGSGDWRNDETMAGGDAFFEEGIHWLHLATSLGPRVVRIEGFRPAPAVRGGDRRAKSMMVAFEYDTGAVGALYYSREVPSLFRGLRISKLMGREGIISFESNGAFVVVRGKGLPRVLQPGLRDIRGYQAMYRDFHGAIREERAPQMSLERALEDQLLMDRIYASVPETPLVAVPR